MKKVLSVVAVLALMVAAIVAASPYWAVYQLKKAYDTQDAATINAAIDFPQVQQSVKTQLSPVLIDKANKLAKSPILQMLNIELHPDEMINTLVNQAVDNGVTADGVNYVLTGQAVARNMDASVKLLGGLVAVAMDKIDIKDLITAKDSTELNQKIRQQLQAPNPNPTPQNKPSSRYCGFNCFEVNGEVRGYPLTLTMQRQGLVGWKIVAVKLPF